MKTILNLLVVALLVTSCTGSKTISQKDLKKDTSNSAKDQKQPSEVSADSTEADPGPSLSEVLSDLRASYNKIQNIDKQAIDGKDTMQLHESYYCLHDSSLYVPGHYMWGGLDTTKDFIANTFVSKITIIKNGDTVFNRIITKDYFNKILDDQLKKYAIIFDAGCMGYNSTKGGFMFGYSISIPLTDIGTAVHLVIDKNGQPTVIDDYEFINKYQEKW